MKFNNLKVYNFDNAFRGMRNPKDSWHLSDSYFGLINEKSYEPSLEVAETWVKNENANIELTLDDYAAAVDKKIDWLQKNGILENNEQEGVLSVAYIGPKDMKLAKQLIVGGPEHRKFLRQIFVSFDITAPLFWFKEFDTYKIGTVTNSTSTMHKLSSYPIDLNRFEIDDFNPDLLVDYSFEKIAGAEDAPLQWKMDNFINLMIQRLEELRQMYLKTKDVRYWKELVRWLPNGWLQTRTWSGNYEILHNMYHQRKYHKLNEWHQFCDFIKTLPYADDLIIN